MSFFPKWIRDIFRSPSHFESLGFLRSVPLLHGLSRQQLGRLLMAMQKRRYTIGEVLFEEGQLGKAVYIVRSGKVELTRKLSSDAVRRLAIIGPGQMFGEMALLEKIERTATARVVEEGDIYLLYTATLDTFIHQNPLIGVKLLRSIAVLLSSLLRRANQELDQHNLKTVS